MGSLWQRAQNLPSCQQLRTLGDLRSSASVPVCVPMIAL
jgi:hypothetical protein